MPVVETIRGPVLKFIVDAVKSKATSMFVLKPPGITGWEVSGLSEGQPVRLQNLHGWHRPLDRGCHRHGAPNLRIIYNFIE